MPKQPKREPTESATRRRARVKKQPFIVEWPKKRVVFLGEPGTEQFTVAVTVNADRISSKYIHDPFIRQTVVLKGWKHAWNALFGGIFVEVRLDASQGAQRAVMTLNPLAMAADTVEIQNARDRARSYAGAEGADCGIGMTPRP